MMMRDRPPTTAVLMSPANGCRRMHAWVPVTTTERHEYQQCANCTARRVLDLDPDSPAGPQGVDVDWCCRHQRPLPDLHVPLSQRVQQDVVVAGAVPPKPIH